MTTYPFAWEARYRLPALLFAITPRRAYVSVTDSDLEVHFGPWRLHTPLSNVASASLTGGYAFLMTAGPAHLSLSDLGVTFATTAAQGVCLEFREPVRAIEPTGLLKHPGATLTVADPAALLSQLRSSGITTG